jgi:hypothetical protein
MSENRNLKHDINFLEYPLWLQDERLANEIEEGYVWKDMEGYVYRAGYRPPTKTDLIFLLYILLRSQRDDWAEVVTLSQYEILEGCGRPKSRRDYRRLQDSLERWKMVGIKFSGTFFDGVRYRTLNFGVIDDWGIDEETGKLEIRLAPRWLKRMKESRFFKFVSFEEMNAIRSPLATRLYEILAKTFCGRDRWSIDAMRLAGKIPLKQKYPSQVEWKVRQAIDRINEKTSLRVKLETRRNGDGKSVTLVFTKLAHEPLSGELRQLLDLLPEAQRGKESVRTLLREGLRRFPLDRVRRNLLYANIKVKDQKSFRSFLRKSLDSDWALDWWEGRQALLAGQGRPERAREHEEEQVREERRRLAEAETRIERMEASERDRLRERAVERLPRLFKRDEAMIQRYMKLIVAAGGDGDESASQE